MKDRAEYGFRATLGAATLLMLAVSWPLWVQGGTFPRVPFVSGWPVPSVGISWAVFGILLVAVGLGVVSRAACGVSAVLLAGLVAGDQNRFQPWVYQYVLASLAFATAPSGRAAGPCRLVMIAMYGHSGLAKLDASFCQELGPQFLAVGLGRLGMDPRQWAPWGITAGSLLMPLVELAIAAGLAWGPTRRASLVGAVGLHVALMGVLGPWGLDHSLIVLVWNGALIVEVVTLFGGRIGTLGVGRRVGGAASVVAALLPFGERWGACDPWPAFALYASHVGRVEVGVPAGLLRTLPVVARPFVSGEGPWRTLDLTAWSRAERGVPIYPGGRAALGVAWALAESRPGARVVLWGPASRWTGRRSREVAIGLAEIRALGGHFRLSSRPARIFGPSGTPDARRGGTLLD